MAEEYKHGFVDDYPYIVYADEKILYTGDPDTPYVPGGGGTIDVGDIVRFLNTDNDPRLDDNVSDYYGGIPELAELSYGEYKVMGDTSAPNQCNLIASGMTVLVLHVASLFKITVNDDYEVTAKEKIADADENYEIETVIPQMGEKQYLVFVTYYD